MTKADLIDEVSRLTELTRKDSEVIVETIFESVVRSLRAGDKIEIRGFGSFRTRQRKPRLGRNPKTGEKVEVPAKKIPFFKPSKELKDMVNTYAEQHPRRPRLPHRPQMEMEQGTRKKHQRVFPKPSPGGWVFVLAGIHHGDTEDPSNHGGHGAHGENAKYDQRILRPS